MGTIKQGVFGGFSGGVGTVIGGTWKGISYMRIIPAKISNPRTERQKDQRLKFALTMKFLKPISQFLKIGFKNYAVSMTGINAAMAYNIHNAVEGLYPEYSINYANVLVSCGILAPAFNSEVQSVSAGTVQFSWDDNSAELSASRLDKTMLMVYNVLKGQAVCVIDKGVRSDLSQIVTVPKSFFGDQVHCYIGFISEDDMEVSNSNYVGVVTIAD